MSKLNTSFIAKIMKSCSEKWITEYYEYIRSIVASWDKEHPGEAVRSGLF